MISLGIDFGNSYISVGVCADGEPRMLSLGGNHTLAYNPYVYPVSAYIESGTKVLLGYEAERLRMQQPFRYRNNFKNNLGNHVPFLIDQDEYDVEVLCRHLLKNVYTIAEQEYGIINDTVLTYSNETSLYKKKLLERAARTAGISNIRMISDADAAIQYECFRNKHAIGNIFMICDIGGTTFNLSFKIYTEDGYIDLIPPIMINDCGGCYFTRRILDDLIAKNGNKYRMAIEQNNLEVLSEFERIAEKAKLYLDTNLVYKIEKVVNEVLIKYELSREEYEVLITEYVNTMIKVINYALRRAGIREESIASLIFIGGSAKTPCFIEKICALLRQPLPMNEYPEMAPCVGAALSVSKSMQEVHQFVKSSYKEQLLPGTYLTLGKYNDEDIVWKVLAKTEEGFQIISNKVITFKAYDSMNATMGNEPALLKWLNSSDNLVNYSTPPADEDVWFNAYDKEKGFLNAFDEQSRKVIKSNTPITLSEVKALSDSLDFEISCMPTQAAVDKNEGTFGEEYSITSACPYWVKSERGLNIINSRGQNDSSVPHNGTIGVRPFMVINKSSYVVSGDGTCNKPYKIIC